MLPQPYGSTQALKAARFDGGFSKPRSLNLVVVFSNLVIPWAAFCVVFWALSFSLRFFHPVMAGGLVLIFALAAGISAFNAMRWSNNERASHWYHYFALSMALAVSLGGFLGTMNYRYTMVDAYTLMMDLKLYTGVDVGQMKGQQMMDAGLVQFDHGALDLRKSLGFRDGGNTYCVAPITNGEGNLPVYDFWAVGVNCCSSTRPDFECGQYNNPKARAGLRLLSSEERVHFKLAVQAAEATFDLRSAHPLFFEWVEDPVDEVTKRRSRGYQFFLFCLLAHFGVSVLGVTASIFKYAQLD